MSDQRRNHGGAEHRRGGGSRGNDQWGGSGRNGSARGAERGDRAARGNHRDRRDRADRPAPVRVSAARLAAYDVLRDVTERDAYANLALPARIREAQLDSRDAALATELVSGALRQQGRYDRIIELAADRPATSIDARTLNVLRLGVHQLLSMRTADHAAVNESVELQRKVGNKSAAGFVNGVLRSVGRASEEEWEERIIAEAKTPDEALATTTSHPAWVLRALRDALRSEGRADELEELLEADNRAPRVSLAVLPGAEREGTLVDAEVVEAAGVGAAAIGPSPLGVELESGDPGRVINALNVPDGAVRVQDQGSQLAALALTRAREVKPGEKWLDLCAGPGGKTAVLGAEALLSGATVRANELSEHRAELVERAVSAVSDAVEVVCHDGTDEDAFGGERFDRILVDAPCSGLGALRRRPEARWRKQPSDLPALTALQTSLLDAAAEHLAPGGLLAYVTCSPHLAETRVAVERFSKRHPELKQIDAKDVLQRIARTSLDLAGSGGSAQLWPHRHGTDAMFIALFEA